MAATKLPRLLDQVRERCRVKHYSLRTEQAYTHWIRRFILHHGKRHPRDMGAPEVEAFLTYLAVRENVAATTQNQALAAILFLYREVLAVALPWLDGVIRAKKPPRLPVVLTREAVRDGKGGNDRHTMLPDSLVEPLRRQLVQLVLRLEVAQLGIGQHGLRPFQVLNTILGKPALLASLALVNQRFVRF